MISFIDRIKEVEKLQTRWDSNEFRILILGLYSLNAALKGELLNKINYSVNVDGNSIIGAISNLISSLSRENKYPNLDSAIELSGFEYILNDSYNLIKVVNILFEGYTQNIERFADGFEEILFYFKSKLLRPTLGFSNNNFAVISLGIIDSNPNRIYNPFCGTGDLINTLLDDYPDAEIFGSDIDYVSVAIAKMRFMFHTSLTLNDRDILGRTDILNEKFDAVLIQPPFKERFDPDQYMETKSVYLKYGIPPRSNGNLAYLQLALHHTRETGKTFVILPNSSLSTLGNEKKIRKSLVDSGLVEAIITLPKVSDRTTLKCSLWVLSKQRESNADILLADLSGEGKEVIHRFIGCYRTWSRGSGVSELDQNEVVIVDPSLIKESDYNLLPNRYLPVKGLESIDLDKLVPLRDILSDADRINRAELPVYDRVCRIRINDLSKGVDNFYMEADSLEDRREKDNLIYYKGNVLLVAKIGNKLRPSYLLENEKVAFVLNHIMAFKIDTKKVRIDYLIQELNKDYVNLQMQKFDVGAAMISIRKKDFYELRIVLPDLTEQEQIVRREKEIRFQNLAEIHGYKEEIEKLKEAQRRDLGSKKHNIMQHLNNVKSSNEVLLDFMDRKGGILRGDEIVSEKTKVTVRERIEKMGESIDDALYYVDNLTNDLDFAPAEELDVYKLLLECVKKGRQPKNVVFHDATNKSDLKLVRPIIKISKLDFEILYNNILENAIKHGFIDEGETYRFAYSVRVLGDEVVLVFENNGKPFPKGMGNEQAFCTRGEKAGLTGNTGEGGWKICQIVEHFGGELAVFDIPDRNMKVKFQIKFELIR